MRILLMNTFAPLIDHYVYEANMNRRAKRTAAMAEQRSQLITKRGEIDVLAPDPEIYGETRALSIYIYYFGGA